MNTITNWLQNGKMPIVEQRGNPNIFYRVHAVTFDSAKGYILLAENLQNRSLDMINATHCYFVRFESNQLDV